jgi:hypothetical protein
MALEGRYSDIYNDMLQWDIYEFQHLQVFDERGVLIPNNRVYFEFKNWLSDYPLMSFKLEGSAGQAQIADTNYVVDGTEGIVTFNPGWKTLTFADVVMGRYSFRYFTNAAITAYINQTNAELNAIKSANQYALADMPTEMDYLLSLGTYVKMLRKLVLDQIIWKNRYIFGDGTLTMQQSIQSAYSQAYADYISLRDIMRKRRGNLKARIIMDYNISTTRIPATVGDLKFVGRYI